jgi:hypothetical protein
MSSSKGQAQRLTGNAQQDSATIRAFFEEVRAGPTGAEGLKERGTKDTVQSWLYQSIALSEHYQRAGSASVTKLLLEEKASPNAIAEGLGRHMTSKSPLQLAVQLKQLEETRLLITHGADVHFKFAPGEGGGNCLLQAADNGATEMVELLVQHKATLSSRDNNGFTALHRCVRKDLVATAVALLDAKADPNLKDRSDNSCLQLACLNGKIESARALLLRGAKPNVSDATGSTPLMAACFAANHPVIRLLLAHSADPNLTDQGGMGAFDYMQPGVSFHPPPPNPADTVALDVLFACAGLDVNRVARKAKTGKAKAVELKKTYAQLHRVVEHTHALLVDTLSNHAVVDTRVGRGGKGIYQEPLERVLEYCGLRMKRCLMNKSIDKKAQPKGRLLLPAAVSQWHQYAVRHFCSVCGCCELDTGAKMKKCPCGSAFYCSIEHQKSAWRAHMPIHKMLMRTKKRNA